MKSLKKIIQNRLAQWGYVVRHVGPGTSVTGVDVLRDVNMLQGNRSAQTLFDVGANIGQTTDEFLRTFQRPRIFAFEPSPVPFKQLCAKFSCRPEVKLHNVALSDREGDQRFYVSKEHSVNDSLLKPVYQEGITIIAGQVQTVDGFCDRNGIKVIDLLKIDTQGNDLNVLQGAKSMLESGRIRFFFLEVMFSRMYEGQPGLAEIVGFADEIGFQLVGAYDQYYFDNRLSHFNLLYRSCH